MVFNLLFTRFSTHRISIFSNLCVVVLYFCVWTNKELFFYKKKKISQMNILRKKGLSAFKVYLTFRISIYIHISYSIRYVNVNIVCKLCSFPSFFCTSIFVYFVKQRIHQSIVFAILAHCPTYRFILCYQETARRNSVCQMEIFSAENIRKRYRCSVRRCARLLNPPHHMLQVYLPPPTFECRTIQK